MNFARRVLVAISRLARYQGVCYAIALIGPLLSAAWGIARHGVPYPEVHDEFSYLLGADTFAHGRLANPSPPSIPHFESMHILVEPSYASKYPAGQAAFLALGQVLTGEPFVGVVFEICLLCVSTLWALRGVLSRRAALLGMLTAWFVFGISFYWARSYWGGAIGFSGAMLSIGATARLLRHYEWKSNLILGLGISLLFFSRPVEGGLLTLCLAIWLFRRAEWRRMLPVLASFALLVILAQVQINRAVTGQPTVLPYVEHARQYLAAPFFWILRPAQGPKQGGEALIRQREKELRESRRESGFVFALLEGFLRLEFSMPRSFSFLSGLVLGMLFARYRLAGWLRILRVLAILAMFSTWLFAHYLAPLLAVYWLILFGALDQMRHLRWRGRRAGAALVLLLLVFFLIEPMQANGKLLFGTKTRPLPREAIEQRLRQAGGQHLVFVRRAANWPITDEWVYNPADLDASPVLFVRDLGESANSQLARHWAKRQLWLCEPERLDANEFPTLSRLALKQTP